MYTNNREAYRQAFFMAWQKFQKKLPLETIEQQLIDIMLAHPEYHALLDKPDAYQHQEFSLEENPFFHMSLHLAIREQLLCDRPAGIKLIQQQLKEKLGDAHEVEHGMMHVLAGMLWQAQQKGESPTDEEYLRRLRGL